MSAHKSSLDPVSFLFAQVLTEIDYLYESGHLSQFNYATIAGALLQSTPPGTPSTEQSHFIPSTGARASKSQPFVTSPVATTSGSVSTAPSVAGSVRSGFVLPQPSQPPPTRTASSILRLKNKVSGSAASSSSASKASQSRTPSTPPSSSTPASASGSLVQAAPPDRPRITTDLQGELDDAELGKVNKRLRKAFQGGFLLSQVADQALSLTPFLPDAFKDMIVDKVEEESGEFVQRVTDPRRQAAAKRKALQTGSSVWRVARGGGGTSRASSLPAGYTYRGTMEHNLADWGDEQGEFSIFAEKREDQSQQQAKGSESEPPYQISSIHSYAAGPNVILTTTVTATFLKTEEDALSAEEARAAGFLPTQIHGYEGAHQPPPAAAPPLAPTSSGAPSGMRQAQAHGRVSEQNQPNRPQDPTLFTGHDW